MSWWIYMIWIIWMASLWQRRQPGTTLIFLQLSWPFTQKSLNLSGLSWTILFCKLLAPEALLDYLQPMITIPSHPSVHPIPQSLFNHLNGPWIDLSRPPMTSNNDLLCNDWLTDWLTYLVFCVEVIGGQLRSIKGLFRWLKRLGGWDWVGLGWDGYHRS